MNQQQLHSLPAVCVPAAGDDLLKQRSHSCLSLSCGRKHLEYHIAGSVPVRREISHLYLLRVSVPVGVIEQRRQHVAEDEGPPSSPRFAQSPEVE